MLRFAKTNSNVQPLYGSKSAKIARKCTHTKNVKLTSCKTWHWTPLSIVCFMCSHYVWQLFLFFWVLFFSCENYAKHAVSLAGRQAGHTAVVGFRFYYCLHQQAVGVVARCTLFATNCCFARSERMAWRDGEGFWVEMEGDVFDANCQTLHKTQPPRGRCCKTEWSEMVPNCCRWNASWRRLILAVPCSTRGCLSVGTDDRFGWICCSVKQTDADCVAN